MKAIDAAKAIVGKYTGKWELFGLDAQGEKIVLKSSWQDVLEAKDPVEQGDRAFVTVTDVMNFADGKSYSITFPEGYFAGEDGEAGERYFEVSGEVVRVKHLQGDAWTFVSTPTTMEFYMLGFKPKDVLSASHVTVKTVTREGAIETEWSTRVTTIRFKDAGGLVKTEQFVSLKGFHSRVQ